MSGWGASARTSNTFWPPTDSVTSVARGMLASSRLLKKSVERDRQIDPGVLPCSQYC